MSAIMVVADTELQAREFAGTARITRPVIVSGGNLSAMHGVTPEIVYDIRYIDLPMSAVSGALRTLKAMFPQVPIFREVRFDWN
jgi:hypothetical protein